MSTWDSTNSSRPTTALHPSGCYIIAVFEGRGISREVGIAALDKDTGKVMLVQIADCPTYIKSLHQMHLHSPFLVLVPDTFLPASDTILAPSGKRPTSTSLLVECIREEFPSAQLEAVARRINLDGRIYTLIALNDRYYALSAACALFKYAENRLNVRFSNASLRIRYVPVEGTMMIDPDTARNLELVGNRTHKKSSHSMFGILNHTYTTMAARLLKVNILSPITTQSSIHGRLDAVEELIQTEDRFTAIRDALKTLNKMDLDKLIASLASSEAHPTATAKPASQRVSQILNLQSVVKNVPLLRKALEGSRSQLLQVIYSMLSDERLEKVNGLVIANLNEDCTPAKGGIGAVNSRVYVVKANRNRLLDVARETYKENVSDIFELNRSISEEHQLPLTLQYQETGFVFVLKKNELDGELPSRFINVLLKRGKWVFSSLELKKMNARMKDALDETLILSDKIIQDLVAEITLHIGALYRASEAVALVDMLWSFAHASIMHDYVRPEFTGTLAIKSGRHPILETVQAAGTVVPNDVYCDDSSSFQIIQGPKYGKSTYIRQIGLLTVMAMCGCFVPAEYASFRIHDALLTRLSNDDDMEKSLSTFASEMASSAMILGLSTPKSLILLDELGRGTSPREGVGISHAIAEGLIALKPFVFFATHFNEIVNTLSRQPTVINLYLSVQRSRPTASNVGITFRYKILDGVSDELGHYGLDLARLADFPTDVLNEAKRVAESLAALHSKHEEESQSSKVARHRKALLRLLKLRTQLMQALEYSALPDQELVDYIARFQTDIAKTFLDM
ncbi:muts domain V-domain-containing protein [Cyathus striatus]|nr:muts domain V-domain-containing protein [Cyathus striatus]